MQNFRLLTHQKLPEYKEHFGNREYFKIHTPSSLKSHHKHVPKIPHKTQGLSSNGKRSSSHYNHSHDYQSTTYASRTHPR